MANKRILILGAGLAGLSAAWHLQRKGIKCLVFEKENEVGGLCRSKKIKGFTFDYSGHLLHFKNQHTFNLVRDLLKDKLVEHHRSSWIYAYGRYVRYPFQANLYGLPSQIVKECLLEFISALNNGHPKNKKNLKFSAWINQTFGRGIARHFMVPYNKKFWTVSPCELTCEWLDGFIPLPTLSQLIEGTIKESDIEFGYNARFWYPKVGGINQLPLALSSELKNIYTNCKIKEISLAKKEIKTSSGKEHFDYLISTIPLPDLPYVIKEIPKQIRSLFKDLRWNSIFNLNLGIERNNNAGSHWIYYPYQSPCFFRVGFPHNFSSSIIPPGRGSLYVELAYSKDKPIDKSNIVLQIKEDLKKVGIVTAQDRIRVQDINDIKYGYPIYDKNYQLAREKILKYLYQNNTIPSGRYGSWRYMSMEDVVLDGKKVADFLFKNA